MTLSRLDELFPYFVFFYGILIVFVLESGALQKLARQQKLINYEGLLAHRGLAWMCFWVGGVWSLQNILF